MYQSLEHYLIFFSKIIEPFPKVYSFEFFLVFKTHAAGKDDFGC